MATLQPRTMTLLDGDVPAGAPLYEFDEDYDPLIWNMLKDRGGIYVDGYMLETRRRPLMMEVAVGDDPNKRVEADFDGPRRRPYLGKPSIWYPAVTDRYLEVPYTLPASYSIIAVVAALNVNFGIMGQGAVSGAAFAFKSAGGTLAFQHHFSDVNSGMNASGNVRTDGTFSIVWATFDGPTKSAKLAGMSAATVARLTAFAIETWTLGPPALSLIRVGSSDGTAAEHVIRTAIMLPTDIYLHENVFFRELITTLATRQGYTAA